MLGSSVFYFGLLRNYIIIMATLFDNLNVPRYKADGITIDELVKVPVLVGPRDKTLARLFADPNITRMEALTLPRISFEMVDMTYDYDRKQSTIENVTIQDPTNVENYLRQYVPVPYDLHFSAYIYAKTQEDGAKVLEQILGFFAPEYVVRAQLVPQMAWEQNIAINLSRVLGPQDNYADGQSLERRAVIWTLDFTLKGWFFGPIFDIGIIKFVEVRDWVPAGNNPLSNSYANNSGQMDQITVQPGLLANGSPTTNAAASIPYTQIHLGDDWAPAYVVIGDVNPKEGTGGHANT